nr:hypothetical protein [Thermococcus sp. MAR1]
MALPGGVKVPRGFGPALGPIHGRRGWGFGWWGLGIFAIFIMFARLAFLLLPFLLLGALLYAIMRR